MRRLATMFFTLLLPMTLGAAACGPDNGGGNGSDEDTGTAMDTSNGGDDTGDEDSGGGDADATTETCSLDQPTDISGQVSVHPVTSQIDSGVNLENTKVTLYTALNIIGGGLNPIQRDPGEGACVDATQTITSTEAMASFSLSQTETADVSNGLVGMVDDSMEGDDSFVQTATGLAAADAFGPDVSEYQVSSPSFAVTQATLDQLASAAGATKSDWLDNGVMLGLFVDSEGNALSGVQVGKVSGGSIESTLANAVYPNSDFSDATTGADGGATSDNGVFIVPNQDLKTFGGTKMSTADDSLDTATQQGATQSDIVFTLTLQEASNGG